MKFYIVCAILISCIGYTYSYYVGIATPRSLDIFNPCENQPENVLDIYGLFDFSNLSLEYNEKEEIIVSGNSITIWDIHPTDRIQGTINVMRFDRGSWVPTQLMLKMLDLCSILHIKNDFWYECWLKHVLNINQIKNKCLQPGLKFEYEPFPARLVARFQESDREGFFKMQVMLVAFGRFNKKRPTSICFEIKGDVERQ